MKLDNERQKDMLLQLINHPNVAIAGTLEDKGKQLQELSDLYQAVYSAEVLTIDK